MAKITQPNTVNQTSLTIKTHNASGPTTRKPYYARSGDKRSPDHDMVTPIDKGLVAQGTDVPAAGMDSF
jgi:hypothetical protein